MSPLTRGLLLGLLSCLSLTTLSASSAPASPLPASSDTMTPIGAIVAGFYVDAPSVSPALVRTTVPVPRHTFDPSGTVNPLRLILMDGTPLPTQIEAVSLHPGTGEGAAVVELIGKLDVPIGQTDPITVLVQRWDSARALPPANPTVTNYLGVTHDVPSPVVGLLQNPGQLYVAAEDVFGNLYMLDVIHDPELANGEHRTERYGKLQSEFRSHGWMRPVVPKTGPQGTLPHLFGVHAYVRISSGDPVLELDLRFHNGADGRTDQNPALTDLYFRKLSLVMSPGWSVAPRFLDPAFGAVESVGPYTVYPLVDALPDGKQHFMPELGQFHRRLVIAPEMETARAQSHIRGEGLGFVRPGPGPIQNPWLWSWWNPNTSFFGPQSHLLPRIDQVSPATFRSLARADLEYLEGHLENGTGQDDYPLMASQMGWAHPYGIPYGGMTGGDGIEFYYGLEALLGHSIDGYRYLQLLHRMTTERMPNALYAADGSPSNLFDWVEEFQGTQYVPFYFYMHPSGSSDPWGFKTAPTFQNDYVAANGLQPPYETQLRGYENIDVQHLVRYTGPAKALAWLGNDSLAKDDLELQAELVHMTYHMYENSKYHHVQGSTMLGDRLYVDQYPGGGFQFGRGEGWMMDTMTAAYQLGSKPFRVEKFPWFQNITQLIADGQADCTGFIQATVYIKLLGGKYRVKQSIESAIVENGMFGVLRSVLRNKDQVHYTLMRDTLRRALDSNLRPENWDPQSHAPFTQLAVGPKDPSLPPFCGSTPADGQSTALDGYQIYPSLAYGLALTLDPTYIDYAGKLLGAPLQTLASETDLSNLGNRAALFAVAEYLWK